MQDNIDNEETNDGQIVKTVMTIPTKETVANIKQLIESGDVDPAYIGVVLKKFAKIAETIKKDKPLQAIIDDQTKTHREGTAKTFTLYGAKITVANRGYWDYSQTEAPVLEKLKEIEKVVKEQIKLRETQLQAASDAWNSVNTPGAIVEFGIKPFNISWEVLPKLVWEDLPGELTTSPPTKHSGEQLRYSV